MAADVTRGPDTDRPQPGRRLTATGTAAVAIMTVLPLVTLVLKHSGTAIGAVLHDVVSLAGTPEDVQSRVANVLFVPLGAVLVVFFRVTLGVRVLGPFRSVLLAIAFQATGVPLGLFFLALVVSVIVAMRPALRALRLPYYSRLSISLGMVAVMIMLALVVGRLLHMEALTRAAYFPMVVLCLTADGFASTLRIEGLRSALWRITMTALVAVLIAALSDLPGLQRILSDDPELILVAIAAIILISQFLGFRLLSFLNPPVKRRKRRRRKSKRRAAVGPAAPPALPAPEPIPAASVALSIEPRARSLSS